MLVFKILKENQEKINLEDRQFSYGKEKISAWFCCCCIFKI